MHFVYKVREAQYKADLAARDKQRAEEETARETAEREVQEHTRTAVKATSDRERNVAKTKAREAKDRARQHSENIAAIPPKRKGQESGKVQDDNIPSLLAAIDIDVDFSRAVADANTLLGKLSADRVTELDQTAVDVYREQAITVRDKWTEIVNLLGTASGNRRSHLFVASDRSTG
jgi:hypothetical protein